MARIKSKIVFVVFVFFANLFLTSAFTVPSDVVALGSLYASLFAPKELTGWRLIGDPCGGSESWRGVTCSGPGVVSIDISGLGVNGDLASADLASFMSLKELDLSNNNIIGGIPSTMPPNATRIDLSRNHLTRSLPYPLPSWKHLKYLNVSHNMLYGPIGDVFNDMNNLEKLDLSFNKFFGDLPSSIAKLTNIHELHLENNHFRGSVSLLANLPLNVLHIEHNFFSCLALKQFQSIRELGMDGSCFEHDDAPSPFVKVEPLPSVDHPPAEQSSSPPSAAQNISPSPEAGGVSLEARKSYDKRLGVGAILGIVCGMLLAAILAVATVVSIRRRS